MLNVKLIVHIICIVAVSMLVESIIESTVSFYEGRNEEGRLLTEERAELERMITTTYI